MTTNPGGREADENHDQRFSLHLENQNGSSEKLTVSREEIVKGVVIKGIVCTPKTNTKNKNRSKSMSTTSLNPFEKRKAPNPPPIVSESESVPKTKSKNKKRGVSKS